MKTLLKNAATIVITLFFAYNLSAQIVSNTFYVRNINDSGTESFRQAIANAAATTATTVYIYFNLPAGSTTITLQSEIVTNYTGYTSKTINIYGANSTGQVIITGTGTQTMNCLRNTSYYYTFNIYSLQFQNFIYAVNSAGYARIGSTGTLGNVFVNNNRGIYLTAGGTVIGNYFGTNKSFSTGLGNYVGMEFNGGYGMSVSNNYICSNDYGIYAHNLSTYQSSISITNNIVGTNNTTGTRTDLGNDIAYYGYNGTESSAPYFSGNTFAYSKTACLYLDRHCEIQKNDFICNNGRVVYNRAANVYPTPTITTITPTQYGSATISGTTANLYGLYDSIVLFVKDPTVCSTTPCQGKWLASVAANANKQWTAFVTVQPGQQITALANGYEYVIGAVETPLSGTSYASLLTGCYTIPCPSVAINFTQANNVLCYGGTDGAARLSITPNGYTYFDFSYKVINTATNGTVATGTINPYTSQTQPIVISSLSAGTYNVVISNPYNNCSYTSSSITITQPNAPLSTTTCKELSPVSTTTSSDGVGQVVLSGGTPPYRLSVQTPTGAVISLPSQTSNIFNITGLAPGTYNVIAYDAGYAKGTPKTGCTATCSFTISTPSCTNLKVAVNQTTNPLCYGGFGSLKIKCTDLASNLPLTLSLSNGFSQTISSFSIDSTVTVSNLPAGNYTITLKNRANCTVVTTATITQPTPVTVSCDTGVVNAKRVGEASGSENVSIYGGTPPYTLNLTGSEIRTITNIYAPYGSYNIPNLKAGSYTVKITDNNGCTSGNCNFVVKDPDCTGFNVTAQTDSIRCFGENNGKITLTTVNGTQPIVYLWSANANTPSTQNFAQNLGVGTYSVTTTDDRYCKDTTTATIYTPSVLATSVTKTDAQNVGIANGKATVTVSGGTPTYNVNLTLNGTAIAPSVQTSTVFSFDNLAKGTYIALTTDARGCSKWDTIRINDPSCSFQITGKADSVSCYNGNNGRITITPNSTQYPITYTWNQTGLSGNSVSGLRTGAYTVTATTSQNCSDTLTTIVYQPDSLAVFAFPHDATLVGGSNGSIDVTINGGTQAYSVMLGTTAATRISPTSFVFNNLSKGTYSFIVTDAKGCTVTQTATIKDPDCSLMSLDKQVDSVICKGGATGRITLVVNNTVGAVSYLWSPPSVNSGSVASNLVAGTYFATATDSRNCKANISVTVFEPSALTATSVLTHITTVNGSNGRISVTVNGGTPPYSVRQDTMNATAQSATVFNFNNLKSGTYTYTATDNNGCTTSQTVTITEPICNLAIAKTSTNVSCNGQSNGSINNIITGGRLPLTILWSNGATTPSLTNIAAGTYSISVKDSVGCIKNDTTIITEPPVLAVNVASTNITRVGANNGTITLVASGGTPTYALNMTLNGTAISPTSQTPPQYNFTNLGSGTYLFTFTDAKNCTKTGSVTITEPTCRLVLPTPTVVNVSCYGGSTGSITANPTGGSGALTYTWNPAQTGNSNIATGLNAGLYRLTVSDTLGCIKTDSMRVSEPPALSTTPTVTNVGTIGGNNGSINIRVSGGTPPYTVTRGTPAVSATRLTDSTFVFNTLTKGTYTYTVTDSKGCTTTATVTVSDPSCTLEIATTVTDVSCNGQSNGGTCVTTTGGTAPIRYNWSNGATTACLTNIPAGTYTVTVTDVLGCIKTATTTVSQPTILAANVAVTNITRVGANNGTITLVASGGTPTYALNMTLNGTAISPTSQTPPQYNFTNLGSGTYLFTFTDAKNCTKTGSVTITEPTCRLVLPTPTVVNVSCYGGSTGSITANPTGGSGALTYTWNPAQTGNSNIATGLNAGLYRLTVSDTLGCIKTDSMRVSEPPALSTTPTVTNVGTIGGNNGSINIRVSGGTPPYTVTRGTPAVSATRLTDSTFVFNTLTKGTYTYTVTDSKGCATTATVTVNDPSCGTLILTTAVTDVSCKGDATGNILVTPTGGTAPYTYVWTPTNLSTTERASNLRAGTYTVSVTDNIGCTQSKTITIAEPSTALSATATATATTTTVSTDGTITVTVSGGTAPYIVRSGTLIATTQSSTSFIFNNLASRDYIFTVTDDKNCTTSGTVNVGSPNCNLSVETLVTAVKCKGEATGSIVLMPTNVVGGITVAWTPSSVGTGSSAQNLRAGTYSFTVTDGRNCSQSRTITITEPPVLDSRSSKIDVTQIGISDGRISVVGLGGTPPYSVSIGTTTGTQIQPDSFVFTGLGRGNYTYILKDANGCTVSQTIVINDPSCAAATADLTVAQQISCFGASDGRLNLATTNFETPQYSWNPSSIGNVQNPSGLKAGLYIVTVSDARGCSLIKQITLTEPLQIKATLLGDTTICKGQSTILRFSVENATNFVITYTEGAQNFTTTSLQATVSPAANTTYRLVSINVGTCAGLVSSNTTRVNVTIPTSFASIKAQKDSLCEGGTITLVPSPLANQYVWQRPNLVDTTTTDALVIPNANSTHAGNYTVKARQSGCLSPASPLYKMSVFAKPTEKPNAGVDKLECDGTTTTLNATAITSQNATGRWISVNSNTILAQSANNITTATNLSVGLNTFVWVLSSAFCGDVARDTVVISVSGKPELDGTPSINLDSKLTTALINTRELLKNKSLDPSVFSFKILNKPEKTIVNVVNNGIFFDRNDLIDGQTIEIEFEICSKICTSQCTKGKMLIVLQPLVDDTDFRVPKVFSLNNTNGSSLDIDGIDLFVDNEITIVNRWGSIVFGPTAYKNDTPEKSWNGTKNGKPLPTGAYYYYIRYKDNAVLKTKRGVLYLVEE